MALLPLGNTPRATVSGVSSVSAFAGDDCSAPEEQSNSAGFCGVVKGKLRKEKGGCAEGVGVEGKTSDPDDPADGPELFEGESRKLAEPRNYVCVISRVSEVLPRLTLLTCTASLIPTAICSALQKR